MKIIDILVFLGIDVRSYLIEEFKLIAIENSKSKLKGSKI
jgi:hypothetical protein